jgi:hypothetical protein
VNPQADKGFFGPTAFNLLGMPPTSSASNRVK